MAQQRVVAGLNILLPIDEDPPRSISPAPRLETFDGKVIGLFGNTKDNVDQLLIAMQSELEAAFVPRAILHRVKEHFAVPAALALLHELHRECDAILVAAGT